MKKANYILETHFKYAPARRESFIGTRVDARARCREIDAREDGTRKLEQTTSIAFVRYEP